MAIENQCTEANFSVTGEDRADNIKVFDVFKYFGRPLNHLDKNWPEVLRNIRKARQAWVRLGGLLRREEADPFVSAKFYRVLVQAVLLFG